MIVGLARCGAPLALAVASVALSFLGDAAARPGGGHGYSGGGGGGGGGGGYSSSGGGGGDGGGGELIVFLIRLLIEAPQIGVPLTVAILVAVVWIRRQSVDRAADWDSVAMVPPPPPPSLDQLRRVDPEFSQVLFEDFAFRLYAEAHRARSRPEALAGLAPYLTDRARTALANRAPQGAAVENIVIGAMHIRDVVLPPRREGEGGVVEFVLKNEEGKPYYAKAAVVFEANMTAGEGSARVNSYVHEQWVFWRDASVQSRPPSRTRAFHCPNCGAPFQSTDGQTCAHCSQVVSSGRFDWVVSTIALQHSEDRPPALGGYAPEVGTHGFTITHPALELNTAALRTADPAFTREMFAARLALVYAELNAAWTERDLVRARPYVSDGLHDYLRFWIDSYQRQGLTNRLEDMKIVNWQPAKLVRDRHFDAFTVRLWGTGKDYTVDGKGKVVGGRPNANRDYSEYWTLIRGAAVRGAPRDDKRCPNCGAEMKISMAGNCEFCQVHVTSGEFDWVLSKIEQDESYQG